MTEKTKGKQPDFKGDGVAVWQNVSKDGTKNIFDDQISWSRNSVCVG
jgi:hypothetical protein